MMILALIALNAAANSFSQPLPDVLDQELEDRLYSSADLQVRPDGAIVIHPGGVHLVLKPEGGYEYRTFDSNPFITGPGHGGPDSPPSQDRDHPAERAGPRPVLGTILFKSDGSVVGYEGKPGQKSGRAHVIRPPIRSLFEMWSLTCAGGLITLLVVALELRPHCGPRAATP